MNDVAQMLSRACDEAADLLPRVRAMHAPLAALCRTFQDCWSRRGKVLLCGNGGSAADAMHFAEELVVRFARNRRGLAAIALTDPTVVTCCGNDFGYDRAFARQVEALGNADDVLVVLSTSGNSPNCVLAVEIARQQQLRTVAFLGKDGGTLRGRCDVELLVPSPNTARIQEMHKLLFHTACEWFDAHND
jgi:D-sedoheptulose 7-phosphate isomerase